MKRALPILMMLIAVIPWACRSGGRGTAPRVDPIFRDLSKEQIEAQADELFTAKKWVQARRFYSHLYEISANNALGRRSLLRVADTYFNQGGTVNLIEAQYKYRDFTNRYPGSDMNDYATLQIAMVSFKQMERPDRDQTKTKEAVQKLQEMLDLYPSSPHREEALASLTEARNRLAKHEFIVALFYQKRGACKASIGRLNALVDEYPDFETRDAVFFQLGVCLERLGRSGEARLYYERVLSEFPKGEYAARAKERLAGIRA